jgi:hypothetical protein
MEVSVLGRKKRKKFGGAQPGAGRPRKIVDPDPHRRKRILSHLMSGPFARVISTMERIEPFTDDELRSSFESAGREFDETTYAYWRFEKGLEKVEACARSLEAVGDDAGAAWLRADAKEH